MGASKEASDETPALEERHMRRWSASLVRAQHQDTILCPSDIGQYDNSQHWCGGGYSW